MGKIELNPSDGTKYFFQKVLFWYITILYGTSFKKIAFVLIIKEKLYDIWNLKKSDIFSFNMKKNAKKIA